MISRKSQAGLKSLWDFTLCPPGLLLTQSTPFHRNIYIYIYSLWLYLLIQFQLLPSTPKAFFPWSHKSPNPSFLILILVSSSTLGDQTAAVEFLYGVKPCTKNVQNFIISTRHMIKYVYMKKHQDDDKPLKCEPFVVHLVCAKPSFTLFCY